MLLTPMRRSNAHCRTQQGDGRQHVSVPIVTTMGTYAWETVSCLPLGMQDAATIATCVLTGVPHLLQTPKGVLPGPWQPLHRIYLLFKPSAARGVHHTSQGTAVSCYTVNLNRPIGDGLVTGLPALDILLAMRTGTITA